MKAFFYQLLLKILPQSVFITRFPEAIDHIAVAYSTGTIYKIRLIRNGIMHYGGVGAYPGPRYESYLANGLLSAKMIPHTSKACYVDAYEDDSYDAKCLGPKSWPDQVEAMYDYDKSVRSNREVMPTLNIVLRRF